MGGDFNPDPPIFAAKFANLENYNHILAIANEDGRVCCVNVKITTVIKLFLFRLLCKTRL